MGKGEGGMDWGKGGARTQVSSWRGTEERARGKGNGGELGGRGMHSSKC